MTLEDLIGHTRYMFSLLGADHRQARARSEDASDPISQLRAATNWLFRAQDATPDGGVSRSFSITFNRHFGRRGWLNSYPETTGYIIPTMYNIGEFFDWPEATERATRMALWEVVVQMDNGAIQGGAISDDRSPAVFNTGQVLFGLVRAYRETGEGLFRDAAIQAGNFLVDMQDEDGTWRRAVSKFTTDGGIKFRTYNVRTAWALLEAGLELENDRFVGCAERGAQFALAQQESNGWLAGACLTDHDKPLLHTIAYAIRGILEIGIVLRRDEFVDAALKAAIAISRTRRPTTHGFAGRFDRSWSERATWSCITGEAQMSIIWGKAGALLGQTELLEEMRLTNERLRKVQFRNTARPGLEGGLPGSSPVNGAYGKDEVLSWAVKFFIDALTLEHYVDSQEDLSRVERIW